MSGIYTGAMGILSYMTRMDVAANNIANTRTVGFKGDSVSFRSFEEKMMVERSGDRIKPIGNYQHMVYADDIQTNFSSGLYEVTGKPLDLAIVDRPDEESKSFFVVMKNGQEFLTRNGQFTLDEDRRISTYGGELVSGADGNPIVIPEGERYSINQDGTVQLTESMVTIGTIRTVSVAENDLAFLQKEKGSLFSVMDLADIENVFGPLNALLAEYDQNITYQKVFGSRDTLENILQTGQVNILGEGNAPIESSMVEGSNVQLPDELISMMEIQRGVQASQKVWQTMSDILELESQRIGQ